MRNRLLNRRVLPVDVQLSRTSEAPVLHLPDAGIVNARHIAFCSRAAKPIVTKSRRLKPRPKHTGLRAGGAEPKHIPSKVGGAKPNMVLPSTGKQEPHLAPPRSVIELPRCRKSEASASGSVQDNPSKKEVVLGRENDRTGIAESASHTSKVSSNSSGLAQPCITKALSQQASLRSNDGKPVNPKPSKNKAGSRHEKDLKESEGPEALQSGASSALPNTPLPINRAVRSACMRLRGGDRDSKCTKSNTRKVTSGRMVLGTGARLPAQENLRANAGLPRIPKSSRVADMFGQAIPDTGATKPRCENARNRRGTSGLKRPDTNDSMSDQATPNTDKVKSMSIAPLTKTVSWIAASLRISATP